MPRGSSRRDPVKPQTSGTRVRIALGVLLITAIASMNSYAVRELLVVLLLLAVVVLTIFAISVGLILCQEGLVRTIHWTRTGVTRFAAIVRLIPEAPEAGKK
jgi:hypothetical protein